MNHMVKKVILYGIALVMALSLFACGGSTKSTTATESGTKAGVTDAAAPEAKTYEPVTLTAFNLDTKEPGISKRAVMAQIAKDTGVTINWVIGDAEKFKVLAASDSLPDMIENEGDAQQLIAGGQVIALDELLGKYGQNIIKRQEYSLKYSKEVLGGGKGIYFLPSMTSKLPENIDMAVPGNGLQGLFARYDIYQEIGSPKINNADDYLNVLKQMQDYQQKKLGSGVKVYALSAWLDWGAQWAFQYGYGASFSDAVAEATLCRNYYTGEVTSSMEPDSQLWKTYAWYNKAYRMGILDPEGFTQKWDQMLAKVANGTVIASSINISQPDPATQGENAGLYALPGTESIAAIYTADSPTGWGPGMATAITKKCKYPERAMQFLDYLASDMGLRTLMSGVKGEDWDYVNGVPQFIGAHLEAINNGTIAEFNNERQISDQGFKGYMPGVNFICDDGYPANLHNSIELRIKAANAADRHFAKSEDKSNQGFLYPGQVYAQWIKDGLVKTATKYFAQNELAVPLTPELEVISSTVSQYMDDNYASIIMAKSDAEFEAVKARTIDAAKKMGIDKVVEYVQRTIEEAKVTADKLGAY